MKLKEGFVLHIAGEDHVVIATGEASKTFNGLIRNNASAAYLCEKLLTETSEEELVQALLERYDVADERAREDVAEFLEKIAGASILE